MPNRLLLITAFLIGVVAAGVGISNYYKAVTFVGMFVIFGVLHLAVVEFDLHLFKVRTRIPSGGQPAQPKAAETDSNYRPNLPLWGTELLLGVGVIVVYFFSITGRRLLETSPTTNLELLQNLTLFAVFTILLGFVVWGIVRLCRAE